MAGSLNKVMLIGNLGKDPETRHFDGGGMLVKFPVATSETYTNRNGERVTQTEWHNIVVTRKGLAEVCEKYLKKGHKVFLEGKLKTRSWTDDAGQNRYMTEVQVDSMTMLTNRDDAQQMQERDGGGSGYNAPQNSNSQNQSQAQEQSSKPDFKLDDEDDDLPF
jgi:single-strand DNA-binding protein